jgi:5-methylcytosine-specific restriction endonuclease McrA
MKIKISKGGTEKKTKNIMSLCENGKNQKGGWTEEKTSHPCMKMKIS